MHKYYATLEHPRRWTDFAPEEFHNKEYKTQSRDFEHIMLKHICNYRIFRNTVFEIMDCERNNCTASDIQKLLIGYIKMSNYIGSAEGLYNEIMNK